MNAAAPAGGALRYRVQPARTVGGELEVPGDKSISHRALLLGALAHGPTEIEGFLPSADCMATSNALRQLGVRIDGGGTTHVRVHGQGALALRGAHAPLDLGNAGTAMRLIMGALAGQPFDCTLIGDASLMARPMERVAVPLRLMGAQITTREGRPPVHIRGRRPLDGIDYALPMASAQVKSAVLLAGVQARGRTRVRESARTRDHTERMLRCFGVELSQAEGAVELSGPQSLQGTPIRVPGDFSSAAFFLVAGCLAAREGLTLRGVGVNPTRAGLIDLLRQMGAEIRVATTRGEPEPMADIEVRATRLRGIEVPPALVPIVIDELPAFFIAAACADGESRVTGAGELRVKESDRLAAMAGGLATLGVEHELLDDGLRVRGRRAPFEGGRIDSRGDHRIAMAFAVAGVHAGEPLEILDVANVGTSFPGFVQAAKHVGLAIEETADG